jgi:hypothetical protein
MRWLGGALVGRTAALPEMVLLMMEAQEGTLALPW